MFYLIIQLVQYAFNIYSIMLVIYILMSWIPNSRQSSIGRILENLCEPYLGIFRRFIPPIGMIDISPIVALLVLNYVQKGILIVIWNIYKMIS